MNETIRTILNRRSIRRYSPRQINNEELSLILKAGLYAPSAHNEQSWHFTVVQNKEIINKLNHDTKSEMLKLKEENLKKYAEDENFNIFYNAPTVIVISGEKNAIVAEIDCAAATQNMLVAAESLEIGSCWIGLVTHLFKSDKKAEYINLLNIPEGFEPYYAITIGYKVIEDKPASVRREKTINYV